jgi:pyruvate,water dikinase
VASRSAGEAYRWAFETFGGPLDTIAFEFVNGKAYRRLVPLVGGDRSGPPPPAPVLWLASRLHPAFRRRNRVALRTFATESFLEPIDRWDRSERQEWVDANLALQRERLDDLDDAGLADHVERVVAHNQRGWTRHHQLHATDMGPIGDLLTHTNRWGLDPVAVMGRLKGRSPATVEASVHASGIAQAVREAGVDPASIVDLDGVRAAGPAAAARLDAYLELYGWRIVSSYDIEGLAVCELPGGTVAMIRSAGSAAGPGMADGEPGADAEADDLRRSVPADEREAYDRLLTNARRAYGLRDDNGPLTAEWPMGLIRRAYLEAGRRLAARARIAEPSLVFELDGDELASVLRGNDRPDADELAQRAEHRRWEASLDPPARLGDDAPDPSPALLPAGLRRMVEVVTTAVSLLEPEPTTRRPLHGLGIGDTPVVGRARVAVRPEDVLQTIEPGDILVAAWTAPTYNAVLAAVAGVVVQEGGLLCHAAVMARELGIPAVIGATDAMAAIGEGDRIEVDPVAGLVRVLPDA